MIARIFAFFLMLPVLSSCQSGSPIQIIPQPLRVTADDGFFTLNAATKIISPKNDKDWQTAVDFLHLLITPSTGYKLDNQALPKAIDAPETNVVYFLPDETIGKEEGYKLVVSSDRVVIRARSAIGAFYAIQTLRQLFPPEINSAKLVARKNGWTLPACTIEDEPRFAYRGMHLDVARHFFPVSFVKKYIDLLAAHKLNVFHWHLTDDQGWRIEIKKYPKLQTVASCRNETLVGHYSDTPQRFDGVKDCGYYTQTEVKEVVEYARKRFVTIIPEIEMPGHALAALTAYPELGCTGGSYETAKTWGVFDDVFCAGNEQTFEFLDNVLEEVCALFPGTYVHVGGDECPKTRWDVCPKCQARIKKEGLKDGHELQSYFIRRAEGMLAKRGKKLIGWDEILEGGLAPTATVMSWRGIEGGIAAAKAGHDAIMTPNSNAYFDYYQGDQTSEPLAIGGFLPIERVYAYEPIPAALTADEAKHILGVQANLWTEYIKTSDYAEYMAFPRVCALAETAWSAKSRKDSADFRIRLLTHFARLDAMGVNYSKAFFDVNSLYSRGKVILRGNPEHYQIRYTTNGEEPKANSRLYVGPFALRKSTAIKAAVFQRDKRIGNVRSVEYLVHKASGMPYTMPREPSRYTGGEKYGLTNGVVGSLKAKNNWVGLVNHDIDPVIDFGEITDFNKITTHFMNDKGSWIYPPLDVAVYVSNDGVNFQLLKNQPIDAASMQGRTVEKVELNTPGARGRYLKFVAKTFGVIPDGAPGATNGAWLFVDEIVVE